MFGAEREVSEGNAASRDNLTLAKTRPRWISRQCQPRSPHVGAGHRGHPRIYVGALRTSGIGLGNRRRGKSSGSC